MAQRSPLSAWHTDPGAFLFNSRLHLLKPVSDELGVVAHVFIPSSTGVAEAEAGRSQ